MARRFFDLVLVSLILVGTAFIAAPDSYVIESPDVLRIMADAPGAKSNQAELIDGENLVRPDGTVSLGIHGSIHVNGLTLGQARVAIAKHLAAHVKAPDRVRVVLVDVVASNSKVCYVIAPLKGGESVIRIPIPVAGEAKVSDAVLASEGLAATAGKGVWLCRVSGKEKKISEVDWKAITESGRLATNYRLEPGDRVYIGRRPPQ